ncbi:UBX domain-containing protein 1-like [Drosophila pseudoobscura]|uniref:UBX domain-containing protein 1-like n=1 Tax=Drosophila pseudoobscura pseudoobscura TaxID=46245 RepID=A0A6I8V5G1_DROPS|nr:UBX domain-containing protein 1 [Drosophila pseudoobscura]
MSYVQTLVDMGFRRERVEFALQVTGSEGVEPAMEWLLAHLDEEVPSAGERRVAGAGAGAAPSASGSQEDPAPSSSGGGGAGPGAVVKSVKCDDCGKVLKDHLEVEYHAAKTGHSNFSESAVEKKPLSDEEKAAQMAVIAEKLKQKRVEREEREKVDALEHERNRIRQGKEMAEAKRRTEETEMKKIVDERRREKEEDKEARDRVRAQIEDDKAARRAREAPQMPSKEPAPSVSSPSGVKSSPRDYTETRIQVRLQDGSTLTETFGVKEPLSAVRVFIQAKTGIETPFALMTTFPRKLYAEEDYGQPLEVLGLVPTAVITMTKAAA